MTTTCEVTLVGSDDLDLKFRAGYDLNELKHGAECLWGPGVIVNSEGYAVPSADLLSGGHFKWIPRQRGPTSASAAAEPADPDLQLFWSQLSIIKELSLEGSASFLRLGGGASFPRAGSAVRGTLFVRQCYIDLAQLLEHHLAPGRRTFVIRGNPGIGKTLFIYYLMWKLSSSGKTIVWERRGITPVMFSSRGVFEGPLQAFRSELRDPETWYLVDGKPPQDRAARTVLVTSPDWDIWKEAGKRPDCMIRSMPVWAKEEIEIARRIIFGTQTEQQVALRFSRWGGIPRFVLQQTDAEHQALLNEALDNCTLHELTSSMTSMGGASTISHRLLHLTVLEGYLMGPVVFASDWVEEELVNRYFKFRQHEVRDFLAASSDEATIAGFRGKLWERHAHTVLQRGGPFQCRDLQTRGPAFSIEIEPCSSSKGLWDLSEIGTELSMGEYGFGKNKSLAAIDAVIQPDMLFQITVSGQHQINPRGLAEAIQSMQAPRMQVQMYFVVPPDVFQGYTKQSLKRIRGDLAAANVARQVKQFVLRLDF